MRTIFAPALFAASLLAVAPAMASPDICISTRDIKNSVEQNDGKALLFTMRDGTQWRNTLQGSCPDLKYNGYAWVVHNESVCENMQTLRVLQSGEFCSLGKFEKVAPARHNG